MKQNSLRKILAVVMALTMSTTMLPTAAFAQEENPPAVSTEVAAQEATSQEPAAIEDTGEDETTPAGTAVPEETQAPEETLEETPAPEETLEETPAPEETLENTPAPEETLEETPAPEETLENTPAPEETPENTPADEETPAQEATPEEAAGSDEVSAQAVDSALTTTVTIGSDVFHDGDTAVVNGSDTYTIDIAFQSNEAEGRKVTIDIPEGLRLVSGTGIKNFSGATASQYTKETYTPTEGNIFSAYPTWTNDGKKRVINGYDYQVRSGTLVYPVKSSVTGGSITLKFQAESAFYDFSKDQVLNDLVVTYTDDPDLTNTVGMKLAAEPSDGITISGTGELSRYTDYPFPLTVNAGEAYTYLRWDNNAVRHYVDNTSFYVVYPAGAVIGTTTTTFTLGTEEDAGEGLKKIKVTKAARSDYINTGAEAATWEGTITYPSTVAAFQTGYVGTTTIRDFGWDTYTMTDKGLATLTPVHHTSEQTISTKQTIVEEPVWHPNFDILQPNWEEVNGYDNKTIVLTTARVMANGARSSTPVRYRYDADTLDNVTRVTIPAISATDPSGAPDSTKVQRLEKVVYKYKDEPEVVWNSGDSAPMPGKLVYISQGTYTGTNWDFSAESDKYIEYAYIQYPKDTNTQVGSTASAGGYRSRIATVVAEGRPASETPSSSANYSHHKWSSWQFKDGAWVEISSTEDVYPAETNHNTKTGHGGFRWTPPTKFALTEIAISNYNSKSTNTDIKTRYTDPWYQSYDDNTKMEGYYFPFAGFALTNTGGLPCTDPLKVAFDIDSTNDYVAGVAFPYSYNEDADIAAARVTKLEWSYTDAPSTIHTWVAGGDDPMPFTPGTGSGTMMAPDGKFFASFTATLDGWNESTQTVVGSLIGRPVDDENFTTKSSHTLTVSAADASEEYCTGKAGFKWTKVPASKILPIGTDTRADAGNSGTLTVTINPTNNYYTHVTFAVMLPPGVTPGEDARAECSPYNASLQEPQGATLVSSREATAAEIAQANANEIADPMPEGSKIYFYELDNQLATMFNRSNSRYCHLKVQVPITVSPVAPDQVYSYQQLFAFGSNYDYSITAGSRTDTAIDTENLNKAANENGVTDRVVRPAPGNTLTINKDPALAVTEAIASSNGIYHTYVEGDPKTVASFEKSEEGSIKLDIYNTVDENAVSVHKAYVFLPIPKADHANATLTPEHQFDFTIAGAPTLTGNADNYKGYEFRYLTTTNPITALSAATLYESASTTLDANADYVVIMLDALKTDTGVTVTLPIKAPSVVADSVKYDKFQACSIFAFNNADLAIRYNGDKSGYLRASYYHPDWTLTFDSQGGDPVLSQTVEDSATMTDPVQYWTSVTPTYAGRQFDGWFTSAACTTEFDFTAVPTADATAYAKWTEKTYTVQYDTQGGTPTVDDKTGVKWADAGLLPAAITRAGYTFKGWNTKADSTGYTVTATSQYSVLAANDTDASLTLYAIWQELPDITIAYQSANTTMGTVSEDSESVAPASGTPAGSTATPNAGYHFVNWTKGADEVSTDTELVPDKVGGLNVAATYTANFAPDTDTAYTVRYYRQNLDGTGYDEVTADKLDKTGTTATAIDATVLDKTYTGFAKDHVTYEDSAHTTPQTGALAIAGDETLVVKVYYNRNTHNVTYNANGHGTTPSSVTGVKYGASLANPGDLSAAGYTFDGWYTEATGGNKWAFAGETTPGTMPDSDLTLYAHWTPITYQVTFAAATGGTIGGDTDAQTVAYGGNAVAGCTATATVNATVEYEFLGWRYNYTGADGATYSGTVADYTTVPVKGEVTFKAIFAKKPFISINGVNGLVSIVSGTGAAPDPTADNGVQEISNDNLPATMNMKFKPLSVNYVLDKITVTDVTNNPVTLVDGSNSYKPANQTQAISITVDKTAGTIVAETINDSIAFEVTYTPIQTTYKVEHYVMGTDGNYPTTATATENKPDSGTVDAGSNADFTPKTYTGATYDSTKTEYVNTGVGSTDHPVSKNGNTVVKLYYERNKYDVTFNANGHGTNPTGLTGVYTGATFVEPIAPTAAGYTGDGWYTDAGCTDANKWTFASNTMPDGNLTLYYKWTENPDVTISYESSNTSWGTVSKASENVAPATGSPQGSLATAATGYHLEKWIVKGDASETAVSTANKLVPPKNSDNIYETITYQAIFAPNTNTKYEVHYYQQNVTGDTADDYTEVTVDAVRNGAGTTGTEPTIAAKTYTGFGNKPSKTTYEDRANPDPQTGALTIAADGSLVVRVYYDRNTYTVTFDENSHGTEPAEQTVRYAGTATKPADLTEAGYTFGGWYTEAACTNPYDFTATVTDNKTVYAKWTENNVTINYESANTAQGTVDPTTETVKAETGTASGSTATPATGYHFVNWTDKDNAKVSTAATYIPAKVDGLNVAATYTANFAANAYKVKFDANGGTGTAMADQDFTYDTEQNLTANTYTHAGYSFLGWSTDKTATTATYTDAQSVKNLTTTKDGEVTLYAIWGENTVTINYKSADTTQGTVSPATETVKAKTDDAAGSTASASAGYHFVNWTDKDNAEVGTNTIFMPAKVDGVNVAATYTANFAPNAYTVHFDGADTTGGTMADQSFTYDVAQALTANTFVKTGYLFAGWALTSGGTVAYADGASVSKLVTAENGTITLYPVWTLYKPATDDPPISKKVDSTYEEPETPGNFTFRMSPVSNTAGLKKAEMPMPGSAPGKAVDKTIQGAGEVEFGILTFTLPGTYVYQLREIAGKDTHYTYDDNVITVTYDVTLEGDTLKSKRTMEDAAGKTISEAVYTNVYTMKKYVVSFNTEGGSDVDDQNVEDGKDAKEPPTPTKDGYTFTGWFLLDGTPFDFSKPITEPVTLVAGWKANNPPAPAPTPVTDEHPEIGELIQNGTWAPSATPAPTPVAITIPKTSDETPFTLLFVLLALGAAGFVALLVLKKRKGGKK